MTAKFCAKCGTALSPGAKFCPGCGEQASASPGRESLQKTAEVVSTVSSTVSKVGSTVRSVETVARTARESSSSLVHSPAEWEVVVGDMLPAAGGMAVQTGVSTVQEKVSTEISRRAIGHVEGASPVSAPESFIPQKELSERPNGTLCSSCRTPVSHGARFCGNCGARIREGTTEAHPIRPLPACPACGKPITAGKRFCGYCGHHLP